MLSVFLFCFVLFFFSQISRQHTRMRRDLVKIIQSPYTINKNRHPMSLHHSLSLSPPPFFVLSACLPRALLAAAAFMMPSSAVGIFGITPQDRNEQLVQCEIEGLDVQGKSELSYHSLPYCPHARYTVWESPLTHTQNAYITPDMLVNRGIIYFNRKQSWNNNDYKEYR